jgi:hypothetical protein
MQGYSFEDQRFKSDKRNSPQEEDNTIYVDGIVQVERTK